MKTDPPVALITGAGRRVGAVVARTLHAAGYDVALHVRRSLDDAHHLAQELEAHRPASATVFPADLSDLGSLPDLVDSVLARFGRLDAVIHNASSFYPTPLETATVDQWNELMVSNVQAPFFLTQAALPALRQSRGSIVTVLDIYAQRPLQGHALYCMAKASLEAMTRSLAMDLAPDIRVNGVAPGAVLWPDSDTGYEDRDALVARYQSGAALRQIVHESGLSLTTVRQIIVRVGVLRPAQPLEQAVIQMQLRARIQDGWPDDLLCAVYHVTAERVRWLRVAFERMRERDATIIALYRSGMMHREVGAQLGLSVGLISNVISAAGASQGRGRRGRRGALELEVDAAHDHKRLMEGGSKSG